MKRLRGKLKLTQQVPTWRLKGTSICFMFVEQEARGGTTGKIFAGKSDVTNPDK
jgi:hypothetical protein